MRIKIISDGASQNTHVLAMDENGVVGEIDGVVEVWWNLKARHVATAVLVLHGVETDVVGDWIGKELEDVQMSEMREDLPEVSTDMHGEEPDV